MRLLEPLRRSYGIPFPFSLIMAALYCGADRDPHRATCAARARGESRGRDAGDRGGHGCAGLQQCRIHRRARRPLGWISPTCSVSTSASRRDELPASRVRRPGPRDRDVRRLLRRTIADVGDWADARRCPFERARRRVHRDPGRAGQAVTSFALSAFIAGIGGGLARL